MFGADGKLTLTFVVEGKSREMTGTYAVAGNQLTLKLSHDGKERVETRTIKKLTDAVLVTEDKNRKVEELGGACQMLPGRGTECRNGNRGERMTGAVREVPGNALATPWELPRMRP